MHGYIPKQSLNLVNQGKSISKRLAGAWPIDEGYASPILRDRVSKNDFTTISGTPPIVKTPYGHGLDFEGSNYVSANTTGLNFNIADTYSLLIVTKKNATGSTVVVVSKQLASGSYTGWNVAWTNSDSLQTSLFNTLSARITISTTSTFTSTSDYYVILVTYDGSVDESGFKIYVNGVLEPHTASKNTLATNSTTAAPLMLASRGGGFLYDGVIVNFCAWNRSLSHAEASLLYHNPFIMYRPDTIQSWIGATITATGWGGLLSDQRNRMVIA